MISIAVTERNAKKSPASVRAEGLLPAVVYGSKDKSTPISIPMGAFERMWREAGETTIVTLTGLDGDKQTLIHDVQFHPLTGKAIHADFYAIAKGQKLTVNIPLLFSANCPAEKMGHVVVKAMHEVEIEVEPAELPRGLEVDLSKLENVGDHILAGDIKLPPSGKLKIGADEIVVTISEAKEEKIETPAPATEAAPGAEGAPAAETAAATPAPEAKKE